jgi:hypothetical protein
MTNPAKVPSEFLDESHHIRHSEKGAMRLYGFRRFPIALYPEEWEFIRKHADQITKFAERVKKLQPRPQ